MNKKYDFIPFNEMKEHTESKYDFKPLHKIEKTRDTGWPRPRRLTKVERFDKE